MRCCGQPVRQAAKRHTATLAIFILSPSYSGQDDGPKQSDSAHCRADVNRFGTISQLDAMRTGVDYNTAQKAVGLVESSSATIHGRDPAGEICVGFDHHAPAVESSIKNHGLRVSADQLHLFRLAAILQLRGGPFDESPQARIEIRLVIGVDLIVTLDRER